METPLVPRWLHRWAVATVAATVCLLALGAVVTTFQVGMADPIWPTYPWHLLLISWDEPRPGFLIEHTHRLAGYIVGCCVIVLCVGLGLSKAPRWLKGLGLAALVGVIIQGLLGGFRVRLHELLGNDLKIIHGCFAQVVFSLFVSLAVLTAPPSPGKLNTDEAKRLRRQGLVLAGLLFLQLVWGAFLRHRESPLAQRLHLLSAFAVVGMVVWLRHTIWTSSAAWKCLRMPLLLLVAFVIVQILLGVEAWLERFGSSEYAELHTVTVGEAIIRTAHVLVGSCIFASAVALVVLVQRSLPRPTANPDEVGTARLDTGYPQGRRGVLSGSSAPHLEGTA
jgi:heme A synthase